MWAADHHGGSFSGFNSSSSTNWGIETDIIDLYICSTDYVSRAIHLRILSTAIRTDSHAMS